MGEAGRAILRARELLLGGLRDPSATVSLREEDWDLLLRLTRITSLTGRLAAQLESLGLRDQLPPRVRGHMESATAEVNKLRQMGCWEINRVLWALRDTDIRLTLLKGMAYYMADIPAAAGRPFSDVDILVQESELETVAGLLTDSGWVYIKPDAYDQHYYREWMHELAPMRHSERVTVVDLHHAILPRTSRLETDSVKLLAATRPLAVDRLSVLSPVDMIIHSAVHLFHDGDMTNALRDLVDIDSLLRHYAATGLFWSELIARSIELGLSRPLFYALRYGKSLLNTPIPEELPEEALIDAPGPLTLWIMDRLIPDALLPLHPDFGSARVEFSRWLLYVRSHYLRMPLHLLLPHLWRKGKMRRGQSYENALA